MAYIDELRQSRDKATVAYQQFALLTRQYKDSLFCFFEGEKGSDNNYYIQRVKRIFKEYQSIRCGGKKNVLKVHELINAHREYDKYRKAYFVDRDFEKPLEEYIPPIYETPCYSIENFYVSVDVFSEILINILLLSPTSTEYNEALRIYKDRQKEFHDSTILLNAWYACLIDERKNSGRETGVSLEDKPPKDFITFSLRQVSALYDLDKIKDTFPTATEVDLEILEKKMSEFTSCSQHITFRGKYEMHFLLRMIELMIQDSKNSKIFFKEKIKTPFGEKLSNDQAIAVFSSYAETPDSLISYLQSIHALYS